jgi:hypothetical protein
MKATRNDRIAVSPAWLLAVRDRAFLPNVNGGPLYACLKSRTVDDSKGSMDIRYHRPYIESRRIEFRPGGEDSYSVWDWRKLDFLDDGDVESACQQLHEKLPYDRAIQVMVQAHLSWIAEGFTAEVIVARDFKPPVP